MIKSYQTKRSLLHKYKLWWLIVDRRIWERIWVHGNKQVEDKFVHPGSFYLKLCQHIDFCCWIRTCRLLGNKCCCNQTTYIMLRQNSSLVSMKEFFFSFQNCLNFIMAIGRCTKLVASLLPIVLFATYTCIQL